MSDELKLDPPWRNAVVELEDSGELDYGKEIRWSRLEELFGIPKNHQRFPFELMGFRTAIKKLGFWATERGMKEVGIRIKTRREMAPDAIARERRKAHESINHGVMLDRVPVEGMADGDVKQLHHASLKCVVTGQAQLELLRRKVLPPPETVTKSLREACGG